MAENLYNPLDHSVVQALMNADAWQRYEVPHFAGALLREISRVLNTAYWNVHQEKLEDRKDWQFLEIPGLEYRRYAGGDCDCGAESPVHSTDCRYLAEHWEWNNRRLKAISIPADNPLTEEEAERAVAGGANRKDYVWSNIYRNFNRLDFSGDREDKWIAENPHPPCTCGAEASWQPRDTHLATCSPQLPNLKFGPVAINWYKYLGRGTSANVDWDEKHWREWFDEVIAAIQAWGDADSVLKKMEDGEC